MAFRPIDWYDTPLYYDIVFDDYTRPESEFLEKVLKLHGRTRGRRVLEPACGSGRLVAAMASRKSLARWDRLSTSKATCAFAVRFANFRVGRGVAKTMWEKSSVAAKATRLA